MRKWTACVSKFQNNHSAHLPAPQHKPLQRETKATPCLGASHDMPVLRPADFVGAVLRYDPAQELPRQRLLINRDRTSTDAVGVAMCESGLRACPNSKITTPHICLPRNTNPSKEKQKQLPVLVPPTICLSSALQTSWGLSVSLRPCARVATTETAHQQRPHINRCYLESPCAKTANKSFVST